MKIVIEYALIENLIINYFIISSCAALFKVKAKWWFVAALFGAVMAVIFPMFNFPIIVSILGTALVGIIMVCICFPISSFRDFLFYGFGLLFLTFVFGGASHMVTSWFGQVSTLVVCITSYIVFIACKMLLKRLARKRNLDNFTCSVQICCKGRVTEEVGYIDTANVLYDPISSAPIVLISKEVFSKVVGEDYIYYVLKKEKAKRLPYGHYVNVGSAVSNGEMLVFMADKLTILEKGKHSKVYENTLLGLSLANFSKTLNSGVLIHSELA